MNSPSNNSHHRYTCPFCKQSQSDVWILEGSYRWDPGSGWIEYKCPSCEAEFDPDFCDEMGLY